jgi:hypothetical protein
MARLSHHLESLYPKLPQEGYDVTSPKDKLYNCVAWAAEQDVKQWWEPSGEPFDYWPDDVPFDYAFDNYVKVFETRGYSRCQNDDLEPGFEKVAIYKGIDHSFKHVAHQLPNENWTSKLGPDEDIEHKTPYSLESIDNGFVDVILRKPTDAKTAQPS